MIAFSSRDCMSVSRGTGMSTRLGYSSWTYVTIFCSKSVECVIFLAEIRLDAKSKSVFPVHFQRKKCHMCLGCQVIGYLATLAECFSAINNVGVG